MAHSNGRLYLGKALGSVMVETINKGRKLKPEYIFAVFDNEEKALSVYNTISDEWDNFDKKVIARFHEFRDLKKTQIDFFKETTDRIVNENEGGD